MNLDYFEAVQLVNQLHLDLADHHHDFDAVEVAATPSFTSTRSVQTMTNGDNTRIRYDAQDVSVYDNGAFTSEVSITILTKLGRTYVAVKRSERRKYYNGADTVVNTKVREVLAAGMVPVACYGEALDVRKADKHVEYVLGQITADLADISATETKKCVVAYEPIWAIRTGKTATPQGAQEVCDTTRQKLAEICSAEVTDKMCILYGGSVKSANVADTVIEPGVDGGLVNGASLKAEEFDKICCIGRQLAWLLEPTASCWPQNS